MILKTNFNDAFLIFHDPLTACGRIFNEKGNIPFVIKIEKREEEKKLSPTLTKCFANIHTYVYLHIGLASYKVKTVGMLLLCAVPCNKI